MSEQRYELDKEKFGKFICELRKEKGMTQKQLAEKLFLSDKAVSKWETGNSIPDTAMLIPLAEIFEISVTELLMCGRNLQKDSLSAEQVEDILKTALSCADPESMRAYQKLGKWKIMLLGMICAVLGEIYVYLRLRTAGILTEEVLQFFGVSYFLPMGLGLGFGLYFFLIVELRLPHYFDENRISNYGEGLLRMNMPGLYFNNHNWLPIIYTFRIWSFISTAILPALSLLMALLMPEAALQIFLMPLILVLCLGGMFLPVYIIGKKYGKESENRSARNP